MPIVLYSNSIIIIQYSRYRSSKVPVSDYDKVCRSTVLTVLYEYLIPFVWEQEREDINYSDVKNITYGQIFQ